jgi:hypothetical protein
MHTKITTGDKVGIDTDKLEVFIEETTSDNKELQQYQQLVLSVVGKAGIVKQEEGTFTMVAYPGMQDIKIPTKYLVVLPPM